MSNIKINTLCYCVHNTYINKNISGSKLRVCRVKGYENLNKKVYPILKEVSTGYAIDQTMYKVYTDLDKAVEAIGPLKKVKKK